MPPLVSSPLGVFSWSQVGLHDVEILSPYSAASRLSGVANLLIGSGWASYCLLFWLLGSAMYGLTIAVRAWRFQATLKTEAMEPSATVKRVAEQMRRVTGQSHVRVLVLRSSIGPAVVGIWRPVVVLPAAVVAGGDASAIRLILAHEMLHVARGDTILALMQLLVQILWWFNPLVWLATRETVLQSELGCDEEVVTLLDCSPKAYARCLLDVIESRCRLQPIVAGAGMTAAQVTRYRLNAILEPRPVAGRRAGSRLVFPAWALLVAVMVLPGRGITISPEALQPVFRIDPATLESVTCEPTGEPEGEPDPSIVA